MKKFLKMVLAVICGVLLVNVVLFMLISGFVGALSASGSSQPSLPKSGVLSIDMSSMMIGEQSAEANPMAMLQGGAEVSTIGLWDAVQALNAAAIDPAVKYIYLKTDGNLTGSANLEEFRKALSRFRSSGKAVISYIESPTTGSYYLASVADKVYMTANPGATTMVSGVSGQLFFLKDLLDKLGVNVQLIRHGKYKSAGEMFVRSTSSPENLEQNQSSVNSIWGTLAAGIAESREITVEDLNASIDELRLCNPEDFMTEHLVDTILTQEQLKDKLATLAVVDKFKDVKFIDFADYVAAKATQNTKAKQKIAVIYADGEIIDGSAKQQVAGDRFASVIAKVRADSTVKAVVLRVNSPGGSVLASDKMKAELDALKAVKPLVASYGAYAASGGYWISGNCDRIFSDETTLTGSIGCFSMIPDFSGTLKNVAHVNITSVNSNKHGDMYGLMRPLDKDEEAYLQKSVEYIYTNFVNIVAEGRNLDADYVDSIGQGRVWTGAEGLEVGLVDEIGTLEDAVAYAAALAGNDNISAWNVAGYPKPLTTMEMIMSSFGGNSTENVFAGTPLEGTANALLNWSASMKGGAKMIARMPYGIVIR